MEKELFVEEHGYYFKLLDLSELNKLARKAELLYIGNSMEISKNRVVMCFLDVNTKVTYCILAH